MVEVSRRTKILAALTGLCLPLLAACFVCGFGPRTIQVAYGRTLETVGLVSFLAMLLAGAATVASLIRDGRTSDGPT